METSVVFSNLISAIIEFSDLGLGGVALGIASQVWKKFTYTRFLLERSKWSCLSDIANIKFSRISSLKFISIVIVPLSNQNRIQERILYEGFTISTNLLFRYKCNFLSKWLTTNSAADSDDNCLLLLSSVYRDIALGSLKWDLSILLSVFKFSLSFPSKYARMTKSGSILLMTALQISCSIYPFLARC